MTRPIILLQSIPFIFLISIISIFCSCQKEPLESITYPDVSPELGPFFHGFEKEAAKRGLVIDLRNADVKGRLTEIIGSTVGVCQQHTSKEILIDRKFWESSSQLVKELIVFHELGHCYLNKVHNNRKTANGACVSIMRNGGNCIDFYNKKTRADLLDELFLD